MYQKRVLFLLVCLSAMACQKHKDKEEYQGPKEQQPMVSHAKGFTLEKPGPHLTVLRVTSPWPNAESAFTYALVPKNKISEIALDEGAYDAIIPTPVERIVVTSTTHIPALETLGALEKLVGFPETKYISSQAARSLINRGEIKELGANEALNTEIVISLDPEVVIGFSINNQNKAYASLERAKIPVVYNGDWTEESPLGKAEWIKFFAPFFEKEQWADSLFTETVASYDKAKRLALSTNHIPTVMAGSMYRDVWYLPGGASWLAEFVADANAQYIWRDTPENGSLALSWENVLQEGKRADFWIAPAQFTAYSEMRAASEHYQHFDPFQQKKVFTFSKTKGETGGLLFYELAPQRPDLVLKDLIHIFHKELLPDHKPFFFKPLD